MQWRSKARGNLAEEKKLLSLAWREVGGGLGSLPEVGGGVDGSLVAGVATMQEEKIYRGRKFVEGRGKTSWRLPLSLVRIWIRGKAETSSVGGGERLMWGL